jgi:hypothetical protein
VSVGFVLGGYVTPVTLNVNVDPLASGDVENVNLALKVELLSVHVTPLRFVPAVQLGEVGTVNYDGTSNLSIELVYTGQFTTTVRVIGPVAPLTTELVIDGTNDVSGLSALIYISAPSSSYSMLLPLESYVWTVNDPVVSVVTGLVRPLSTIVNGRPDE